MFAALKRQRRLRAQASDLYAGLIRQTRQPAFYLDLGVPDSFDGRFDLLMLHAFLLFRRLSGMGEEGQALAQAVFDTMFADLDHVLRESGVGDMSIGRKIKSMTEAFYGRVKAYGDALGQDQEALTSALGRNVYGGAGAGEGPKALARYVRTAESALAMQGPEALGAGRVDFPVPQGEP